MSSTRDKDGYVLCCHGRPILCGECADEYAAELDGPASGAPAAVDGRSTERATAESTGALERALFFVSEFKGDPRCGLNCLHAEALAAEVFRLRAERDKWLEAFNRSEQFQDGPTKQRDLLRAALAGLRYPKEPDRFCDHAAEPCNRCDAARVALAKTEG